MGTRMRNYRKRSNRKRNNRKRSKRSKRSERGKRRTGRDRIEVSLKGGAPLVGPPKATPATMPTHHTGLFNAEGHALIPDGMRDGYPAYRSSPAVTRALPPGWEKHESMETGRVYYHNPEMRLSQWGFPDELTATGAGEGLPPGWDARVSRENGRVYYRNIERDVTQWEFPVAESEQSVSQLQGPTHRPRRGAQWELGFDGEPSEASVAAPALAAEPAEATVAAPALADEPAEASVAAPAVAMGSAWKPPGAI